MKDIDLSELYRKLLLAREFEEKVADLYTQGLIYGFCHLYTGQEAIAVGVLHYKQQHDSVITSYRDHVHAILCGMDPQKVLDELCGNPEGCCKGWGGSMHLYSKEHRFYGGCGIVGAQVPIGAGLAFAHKYNNDGGISFTFFGDGAANQGQVYETFNLAALWELPILFIIENNKYALGTAIEYAVAGGDLTHRGDPFGIETICVDGMDVLDVLEKTEKAVTFVRQNSFPMILHMDTYRYKGHSMSDPGKYRSREEVSTIKQERDPIKTLEAKMKK
jgi:pyruvate dehydrogenase E1 component alpha subunit